MTKWGSIKIRLEDILVVKRETFTDGRWFSGYCNQYRWGIEHTHSTCLNFSSTPKTWLESSCQAPNHLLAPAILRSKCWYLPTAPRALKKGTLSNHHLRSNPKKHINKNSESTDSDGFWHRLILKLRFAFQPKFQKIWWVALHLKSWPNSVKPYNTPKRQKQKLTKPLSSTFVAEASGHLLANEFH